MTHVPIWMEQVCFRTGRSTERKPRGFALTVSDLEERTVMSVVRESYRTTTRDRIRPFWETSTVRLLHGQRRGPRQPALEERRTTTGTTMVTDFPQAEFPYSGRGSSGLVGVARSRSSWKRHHLRSRSTAATARPGELPRSSNPTRPPSGCPASPYLETPFISSQPNPATRGTPSISGRAMAPRVGPPSSRRFRTFTITAPAP